MANRSVANSKKILLIMQDICLIVLYPKKNCNTSVKENTHKLCHYLPEGLIINKVSQMWTTDITCIAVEGKFMYFVAIIDLYSIYTIVY